MSDRIITIGSEQFELRVERNGNNFSSGPGALELVRASNNEAEIRIGERTVVVPYVIEGTRLSFFLDGETWTADVAEKGARIRARHRDHSMAAPMPGLVLKIAVAPGDVVIKGAPLLVLEAMKMEHQIIAPYNGTVRAVNCREGEMVQPGVDLIEMEAKS